MSVPYMSSLQRKADLRERAGLRRSLLARGSAIDLAGNDYLGMSRHPLVVSAAVAALGEFGLGATGSRLVRGTTSLHLDLEAALGDWLGAPSLVYSSGYLANLGAVRALCGPRTVLFADAHCHASLVDAGECLREPLPGSGSPRAARSAVGVRSGKAIVFPHNDVSALDTLMAARPGLPKVVLVESVYSVDGDLAPLAELHSLTQRHGALLLIDHAHGLGVVENPPTGPDIVVTATLSKSLGGAGGVVAGPPELIRHLVDTGRTFIYDTALPPSIAAGVLAAVDLVRSADGLRAELHSRARLIDAAAPAGVVSLLAPSAAAALQWATECRDRGVAVGCFRPPSTPDGTSRLRLTINVGVARADFVNALEVIEQCRPSLE